MASRAGGAACALRATRGAWWRRRRISPITSCRTCRCFMWVEPVTFEFNASILHGRTCLARSTTLKPRGAQSAELPCLVHPDRSALIWRRPLSSRQPRARRDQARARILSVNAPYPPAPPPASLRGVVGPRLAQKEPAAVDARCMDRIPAARVGDLRALRYGDVADVEPRASPAKRPTRCRGPDKFATHGAWYSRPRAACNDYRPALLRAVARVPKMLGCTRRISLLFGAARSRRIRSTSRRRMATRIVADFGEHRPIMRTKRTGAESVRRDASRKTLVCRSRGAALVWTAETRAKCIMGKTTGKNLILTV